MAKGVSDLGTGLGYIYVTEVDGLEIIKNVRNTSQNVRDIIRIDAIKAASSYASRSAVGKIDIDSVSGSGNITAVTINGINQISSSVSIAGLNEEQAAEALAEAINTFTPAGVEYKAIVKLDQIIVIADESAGSTVNGSPISVSSDDPVNIITTTEEIANGTSNSSVFDETSGFRFFLDADYGSQPGACAGEQEAIEGDLSKAIEITNDLVKPSSPIINEVNLSDGIIEVSRVTGDERVKVDTEGAIAQDDLETFCPTGFTNGDIAILYADDNGRIVTVKSGVGNIFLADNLEHEISDQRSAITLQHHDGKWYEISRASNVVDVLDNSITAIKIIDEEITTSKIKDEAVTNVKLSDEAVTSSKLAGGSVTADKIADGAITVDKLDNQINTALVTVWGSFEVDEQGDYKVKFPFDCEVQEVSVAVVKQIAGTDDATIIPKNHAGDVMGDGVITLPAGLTNGTAADSIPTSNNSFEAGESMKLTFGKTTPGGKVLVSLKLLKSGTGTGGTVVYQAPLFTAFVLVSFNTLEVGDSIPSGAKTFTWSTLNSGNVQPNSIDIIDVTGGSLVLGSGLANDGTETVSLASAITKTAIATHQFKIEAQNTQGGNFNRTHNVNWRFRKFFGNDTNTGPLTESQIEALSNNPLDSGFSGTYFFPGGGYKYFAFPTVWGTPTSFKDQSTMLTVPMEASYIVNLTNSFGVAQDYNVFRSTNILGGDITIIVA